MNRLVHVSRGHRGSCGARRGSAALFSFGIDRLGPYPLARDGPSSRRDVAVLGGVEPGELERAAIAQTRAQGELDAARGAVANEPLGHDESDNGLSRFVGLVERLAQVVGV